MLPAVAGRTAGQRGRAASSGLAGAGGAAVRRGDRTDFSRDRSGAGQRGVSLQSRGRAAGRRAAGGLGGAIPGNAAPRSVACRGMGEFVRRADGTQAASRSGRSLRAGAGDPAGSRGRAVQPRQRVSRSGPAGGRAARLRRGARDQPRPRGGAWQPRHTLGDLGRWADAVACYERAIALRPDDAGFHYNLGIALRAAGQPERAIEKL